MRRNVQNWFLCGIVFGSALGLVALTVAAAHAAVVASGDLRALLPPQARRPPHPSGNVRLLLHQQGAQGADRGSDIEPVAPQEMEREVAEGAKGREGRKRAEWMSSIFVTAGMRG